MEILTTVLEFLDTLFLSPLITQFGNVEQAITDLNISMDNDLKAFLGASIQNFVPINQIIICIELITPIYIINFVIAVILRIKSFVPTMGGK